jgi:hypothetical protein
MQGTRPSFAALTQLYDEMIERVEGYSVSGRELRGREEIEREMDGSQKVFAIFTLLSAVLDHGPGMLKEKTAALPAGSIESKRPTPATRVVVN